MWGLILWVRVWGAVGWAWSRRLVCGNARIFELDRDPIHFQCSGIEFERLTLIS